MHILKIYRRKTELSIENVSFLLSYSDSSTLSRCERGIRKPSIEILLAYNILFEASIDKLFENERRCTLMKIALNIDPLINSLLIQEETRKNRERIVFLNLLKEVVKKGLNKYDNR